ncbi:hypothetical protein LOAG_12165, partial [Loa loa]
MHIHTHVYTHIHIHIYTHTYKHTAGILANNGSNLLRAHYYYKRWSGEGKEIVEQRGTSCNNSTYV